MRAGVPFVLRFTSKFFLEILPAALASVIGGFLFAQYHISAPAPQPVPQATSTLPADKLAAMVEEEHAMLLDYLKRDGDKPPVGKAHAAAKDAPKDSPKEAPKDIASKDAASKDAAPKDAAKDPTKEILKEAVARVRRLPEDRTAAVAMPNPPSRPMPPGPVVAAPAAGMPAAGAPVAAAAPFAPARVETTGSVPPAADPNDPLVIGAGDRAALADVHAPAPRSGVIGSVLSEAFRIKDRAVNATGNAVTFVVRDIPTRVLSGQDQSAQSADVPPPPQPAAAAAAPASPAAPRQGANFADGTW